jgi:hypothetical protein
VRCENLPLLGNRSAGLQRAAAAIRWVTIVPHEQPPMSIIYGMSSRRIYTVLLGSLCLHSRRRSFYCHE